jgi:hypothetical protein
LSLPSRRFDDGQEFSLQRAMMPFCPPPQPLHDIVRRILDGEIDWHGSILAPIWNRKYQATEPKATEASFVRCSRAEGAKSIAALRSAASPRMRNGGRLLFGRGMPQEVIFMPETPSSRGSAHAGRSDLALIDARCARLATAAAEHLKASPGRTPADGSIAMTTGPKWAKVPTRHPAVWNSNNARALFTGTHRLCAMAQ